MCYSSNNDHKSITAKKKYHHNLRWLLCCCWCPHPPPINCIGSNRHLFINPVGCCVCFPVIRAAMIARDEWIHCLFFVELSIPLGWLLCCFKPSPPPRTPARIQIDCCVVFVVFVGPHGPCPSGRRWIVGPSHLSLTCSGPSSDCACNFRTIDDADTAAGWQRIRRGGGGV